MLCGRPRAGSGCRGRGWPTSTARLHPSWSEARARTCTRRTAPGSSTRCRASSRPRSATPTAPSWARRPSASSSRSASTRTGRRRPRRRVELTRRVTDLAPENLTRAFFTSGGSEAVESALKLVRQHWLGRGEPLRRKMIARRGAYHGCTLGALSLTGIPAARAPFEPLFGDVRHAENTDRRNYRQAVTEEEWTDAAVTAIERTIVAEGPQTVAAVVVEPVQNAGGCLTPPPGYPQRLRELCDRHGDPALVRRGDHRVRPAGRMVRLRAARLRRRHRHLREGRHVRPGAARRRPLQRRGGGAAARPEGRLRARLHVRRPSRCRAPSRWPTSTSWSGSTCSPTCGRWRITWPSVLDEVANGSPLVAEARGCGFFRAIELRDVGSLAAARDAIRAEGVIVRLDDRVNPCLAISPPLICTKEQIDEVGAGIAAGLRRAA